MQVITNQLKLYFCCSKLSALRTRLILSILLSGLVSASNAQEVWTLQKCIDHALPNNIRVKQQQLSEEYSENTLLQSKYAVLPNLNASVSHNYNFGKTIDPTTNLFATQSVLANTFSVSSGVTLFNGFQKMSKIKENRFNLLSSQLDTEKTKNDITLNITSAYLQILFNKEQLNITKNQLDLTRAQIIQTQKLVAAGALPEGDLLEIQAQVAKDEHKADDDVDDVGFDGGPHRYPGSMDSNEEPSQPAGGDRRACGQKGDAQVGYLGALNRGVVADQCDEMMTNWRERSGDGSEDRADVERLPSVRTALAVLFSSETL